MALHALGFVCGVTSGVLVRFCDDCELAPAAAVEPVMLRFAEQAFKDYFHVGSILPTGTQLAKALTRPLRGSMKPKRVLEVGPGTGPVTRAILTTLREGDSFTLVEINEAFARQLETKLLAPFRRMNPGIDVALINKPIEEANLAGHFDFIICGIPFNNFPPSLVRSIFRIMLNALGPEGELCYFEYVGMRPIRAMYSSKEGRRRVRNLNAINAILRRRYHGKRILVFRNVPPAAAVCLRRQPGHIVNGEPHIETKPNGSRSMATTRGR
jgi:phosphatidylethanolamine/phosphatidyl-N-methylethanolamine N-methyltransferase